MNLQNAANILLFSCERSIHIVVYNVSSNVTKVFIFSEFPIMRIVFLYDIKVVTGLFSNRSRNYFYLDSKVNSIMGKF